MTLGVTDVDLVGDATAERRVVPVADALPETVTDTVGDVDSVADVVTETVCDGVSEPDAERVVVPEGVAVAVALLLKDACALNDATADADTEAVAGSVATGAERAAATARGAGATGGDRSMVVRTVGLSAAAPEAQVHVTRANKMLPLLKAAPCSVAFTAVTLAGSSERRSVHADGVLSTHTA